MPGILSMSVSRFNACPIKGHEFVNESCCIKQLLFILIHCTASMTWLHAAHKSSIWRYLIARMDKRLRCCLPWFNQQMVTIGTAQLSTFGMPDQVIACQSEHCQHAIDWPSKQCQCHCRHHSERSISAAPRSHRTCLWLKDERENQAFDYIQTRGLQLLSIKANHRLTMKRRESALSWSWSKCSNKDPIAINSLIQPLSLCIMNDYYRSYARCC